LQWKARQSLIDWELGALYRTLPEADDDEETIHAKIRQLFTVGYEGRSVDELLDELRAAGVERLVDVRELPLSQRRGFSKTALGDALREAGILYVHVKALGNPKPNRERYWAGDVEGGAAVYRAHLNNGSRSALIELAESLGDRLRFGQIATKIATKPRTPSVRPTRSSAAGRLRLLLCSGEAHVLSNTRIL
jgi:hypothetical protein